MPLSPERVKNLIDLVAATQDDLLDCDGCLAHVGEFAEAQLTGRSLDAALQSVERHLASCGCCQHEFEVLLSALSTLDDNW